MSVVSLVHRATDPEPSMSPRLCLSLASAAFVALGASAARAAPPLPPPPPAPPPASAAPAADSAPVAAPPPAPRPTWMQRPPPYGPYPGWRLEEEKRPDETGGPQWYGWQSLIGIIPSHAMAVLGTTDNDLYGLIVAGAIGHSLTSPIVHWAHGNVGRGFLSLGLNTGLPFLGLAVGLEARSTGLLVAMGFVTIVGWPIVDTVVLSYEDAPKSNDKNARLIDSFSVVPMIDGDKKGLSLVGQF